jgi:hypothetical protein
MKKPFLNPVFKFLEDEASSRCHPLVINRMGFDFQAGLPDIDKDVYAADPAKFFAEWDVPETFDGYTLVGVIEDDGRPAAIYVQPLTPVAEELLALGLRHMRTAEYATLAKRPSRQRDWVGNHVQLKRKVENGNGTVFPAGLIMKVTGSYRGLTLETVELYKPSGVFVKHKISRVPVDWVDLVVVPFEGGNE